MPRIDNGESVNWTRDWHAVFSSTQPSSVLRPDARTPAINSIGRTLSSSVAGNEAKNQIKH